MRFSSFLYILLSMRSYFVGLIVLGVVFAWPAYAQEEFSPDGDMGVVEEAMPLAEEIVRTFTGSVALMLIVPVATMFSVTFVPQRLNK